MNQKIPYNLRLPTEDRGKFMLRLKVFSFIISSNIVLFIFLVLPTLLKNILSEGFIFKAIFILILVATTLLWFVLGQLFFEVVSRFSHFAKLNLEKLRKGITPILRNLPKVEAKESILSMLILTMILFAISKYFKSYSHVLEVALDLTESNSKNLAVLFITFFGLASLILFVSSENYSIGSLKENIASSKKQRSLLVLKLMIGITIIAMSITQAILYYIVYANKSSDPVIPIVMAVAAFLIAITEVFVFYFTIKFGVNFYVWLIIFVVVIFPLDLLTKIFELIQVAFEAISNKRFLMDPSKLQNKAKITILPVDRDSEDFIKDSIKNLYVELLSTGIPASSIKISSQIPYSAKSRGEPFASTILISLATAGFFNALLEAFKSWSLRKESRNIKIKFQVKNKIVEFEYSSSGISQEELIEMIKEIKNLLEKNS